MHPWVGYALCTGSVKLEVVVSKTVIVATEMRTVGLLPTEFLGNWPWITAPYGNGRPARQHISLQ